MTPTAIIADDEAPLREHLQRKLAALWPELRIVAQATHGHEAAALIDQHQPDVAFLDIKMPGLSGLEVAQGIEGGREGGPRVVFVTAYDQFALSAFEHAAVDYLVKPVETARLARTVERLRLAIQHAAPAPDLAELLNALTRTRTTSLTHTGEPYVRWIRASRGDTTLHIPVQEVLYVQSDDKYTIVHTAQGEHLIRTSLAELASSLDPQTFWQIHRSTLVNMHHVKGTRRDDTGRTRVLIDAGSAAPVELAVSRAYASRFRDVM